MVVILNLIFNHIGLFTVITFGIPLEERDFLSIFGMTSEPAKHQWISSGMPPKERDFLANFGMTSEPAKNHGLSPQFDDTPNFGPIRGVFHDKSSSSSPHRHHPTERNHPNTDPYVRDRSGSPPARCMVPPTTITSAGKIKYRLDQLELFRLIPKKNPHLLFVLRKFTFPGNSLIKIAVGRNKFASIPVQEQIVLSKSDGDVFAILESSEFLAGLYGGKGARRLKMNMETGAIIPLTREEIEEIPVGEIRPIPKNFIVECVSLDAAHHTSTLDGMSI